MARALNLAPVVPADHRRPAPVRLRERTFGAQDGLRLYYRDYGDPLSPRLPVLCLSGLTRNSKDYHKLASRLSEERRVLCLDYRGRGRSEYDTEWRNYVPATYVGDIRHLLVAASVHRLAVIGTSLGGILGMALAVAMPGRLAGVVLNDIGPVIDSGGMQRIIAQMRAPEPQPDWESVIRRVGERFEWMSPDDTAALAEMAHNIYRKGDDGRFYPDWDKNLIKPLLHSRRPAPDLWLVFRALRQIPTLAIRGALSDLLSVSTFDRMAVENPDLVRVTVAGVGHAPTLQEPEAEQAIDAFLDGL